MSNYIRRRAPGGTYFFTARLADRNATLLVDEIDRLRAATRKTMARHPFKIDAIAVLPDVIHTIWTLPEGDTNFSLRWRMLKSIFSKGLPDPETRTPAQRRRRAKGIWQPRFWEHLIRDQQDYERHLHMIHASPVQAGLCKTPQAWAHSSVHRFTRSGNAACAGPRNGASKLPLAPIIARTYREEGFRPTA